MIKKVSPTNDLPDIEIRGKMMNGQIVVRKSESIYRSHGSIENGTFLGRWHFSFDQYHDPKFMQFGTLRVFNDDTLSPGAVWPLHPHHDIEVVTYCAEGEFRHADERGQGGILKKGWVQHTTVGSGMWHSEINNRQDEPMRFIQIWFLPSKKELKPSVEQMAVDQKDRSNRFLLLVSSEDSDGLKIFSDAGVYSSFLHAGHRVKHEIKANRGGYLYVVEGGPIRVNEHLVSALGAAKITGALEIAAEAQEDAELLLVDVQL
jgi:redox-sensitive bicupin YhaK (pirin superfamily)